MTVTVEYVEVAEATQPTARETFRAYIRGLVSEGEVHAPSLADYAVSWFHKQSQEYQDELLRETFRPVCYNEVLEALGETRGHIANPDASVKELPLPERKKQRLFRYNWGSFMEKSGDRHLLLMDMKASDLRDAAVNRRKQGVPNLEIALLEDKLAGDLEKLGGDKTVRDVWQPEDVEAAHAIVSERLDRKLKELGMSP